MPERMLKKKTNSICFQLIREGAARGEWQTAYETSILMRHICWRSCYLPEIIEEVLLETLFTTYLILIQYKRRSCGLENHRCMGARTSIYGWRPSWICTTKSFVFVYVWVMLRACWEEGEVIFMKLNPYVFMISGGSNICLPLSFYPQWDIQIQVKSVQDNTCLYFEGFVHDSRPQCQSSMFESQSTSKEYFGCA